MSNLVVICTLAHMCPFAPIEWNIVLSVTKRHILIPMYMHEKLWHCMCYCLSIFSFVPHVIEINWWGHIYDCDVYTARMRLVGIFVKSPD
jgi:hypothetical protein